MSGDNLRARVDAGLWLPKAGLPLGFEARLRAALSFPNPEYAQRLKLNLPTWRVPETLCFLGARGDILRLPRGAAYVLKHVGAEYEIGVDFDDRRLLPNEQLAGLLTPALRPYQARSVDAAVLQTQGVVVAPCGAGKTRIAMGLIARLRTPTLVLTHTKDLAEQWRREFGEVLGIDAGIIGDGAEAPGPVTVALVQSLTRKDSAWLGAFLARFGMLALDEAHHVAASTFHGIVDRSPARYRFGLSATPERTDGLTPLLGLFLGRTVAAVTHAELEAAGVLVRPIVRTVSTGFAFAGRCMNGDDYYRALLNAVKRDGARNELIARHVAAEARAGHPCLVLSAHIDHCNALCDLVRAHGIEAEALTGDLPKGRRVELLRAAKAGDVKVLVATSLADEGLDWPALSRVFLAFPSKAKGRTVQRIGRLMRVSPGKSCPVLFDFVDDKVPLLRRHHSDRRNAYAAVLGAAEAA